MALVSWSDEYSVGIPRMDMQHQRWFDLINMLHQAMAQGEADTKVGAILEEVRAYTRTHFSEEEALMEQYAFPGFTGHKRVHDAFIKQLDDMVRMGGNSRVLLSMEAMRTMKDWLVRHIQQMDQHYARFLVDKLPPEPPPPPLFRMKSSGVH